MEIDFEELDYARTELGELILRRRGVLALGGQRVWEVKLDGAFLMSSLVNDSEIALAELGLAPLHGEAFDVVVGGLGLGYSAAAALAHPALAELIVVEFLAPVISWHERGLVPLGPELVADPRCRFVHGDFFARLGVGGEGPDPDAPGRRFDAILVDIDHSPRGLLHPRHAALYSLDGLLALQDHLKPGGVFALWSADPPEEDFRQQLRRAFPQVEAHPVHFRNPMLHEDEVNTVYVARSADAPDPKPRIERAAAAA